MKTPSSVSPADLRVAVAASGIPAYVIGARARVHPIKLSRLLRGHDPITPEIASRILLAVQQEVAANGR